MSLEEPLAPNYAKLDVALRSIGYNFEVAVADIVDNSIDAQAENVLIRLITGDDGHLDLAVIDDGHGMSAATLKEAMRFGADVSSEIERRLGKFGLGLKLASLSQARELTVITAHGGKPSGRAWLETGISKGFSSTVLSDQESIDALRCTIPDCPIQTSGTLVCWSHLYRVGSSLSTPQAHAQKLMRRLEQHLSLAFHRFLAGIPRQVSISLDIFDRRRKTAGIPIRLDPLNPFGYPYTGRPGFPAAMRVGRVQGPRECPGPHLATELSARRVQAAGRRQQPPRLLFLPK